MIVDRFVTSRQLAETEYSLRHLFDSNLFCSVLFFLLFFLLFSVGSPPPLGAIMNVF